MHAKLISPGTDVVTPEWHCIVGSGPKGYNCIPLGFAPTS
jgi:hypothetical protein